LTQFLRSPGAGTIAFMLGRLCGGVSLRQTPPHRRLCPDNVLVLQDTKQLNDQFVPRRTPLLETGSEQSLCARQRVENDLLG
jgi:hypothetical protein